LTSISLQVQLSVKSFSEFKNRRFSQLGKNQKPNNASGSGSGSGSGNNENIRNDNDNNGVSLRVRHNSLAEKKTPGGILRRNSSRPQPDLESRMKQRRVAVSFNPAELKEFTPKRLVQSVQSTSGTTDL
jgi:hypothetical protein